MDPIVLFKNVLNICHFPTACSNVCHALLHRVPAQSFIRKFLCHIYILRFAFWSISRIKVKIICIQEAGIRICINGMKAEQVYKKLPQSVDTVNLAFKEINKIDDFLGSMFSTLCSGSPSLNWVSED